MKCKNIFCYLMIFGFSSISEGFSNDILPSPIRGTAKPVENYGMCPNWGLDVISERQGGEIEDIFQLSINKEDARQLQKRSQFLTESQRQAEEMALRLATFQKNLDSLFEGGLRPRLGAKINTIRNACLFRLVNSGEVEIAKKVIQVMADRYNLLPHVSVLEELAVFRREGREVRDFVMKKYGYLYTSGLVYLSLLIP